MTPQEIRAYLNQQLENRRQELSALNLLYCTPSLEQVMAIQHADIQLLVDLISELLTYLEEEETTA